MGSGGPGSPPPDISLSTVLLFPGSRGQAPQSLLPLPTLLPPCWYTRTGRLLELQISSLWSEGDFDPGWQEEWSREGEGLF